MQAPCASTASQESLERALAAFLAYDERARAAVEAQRAAFPAAAHALLPELAARLAAQLVAVGTNGGFLSTMLAELQLISEAEPAEPAETALLSAVAQARAAQAQATAKAVHEALVVQPRWASLSLSAVKRACSKLSKAGAAAAAPAATSVDDAAAQDNVHAVLLQLRREWSDEAADERAESFGVLLDGMDRLCAAPGGADAATGGAKRLRVLVPGAGLGRLVFDVASRGHEALGIEPSFFMLVPAHFVQSRLLYQRRALDICPFAHETANVRCSATLSRCARLPGLPGESAAPDRPLSMRMVGGELEGVASEPAHALAWCAPSHRARAAPGLTGVLLVCAGTWCSLASSWTPARACWTRARRLRTR